MEHKPASKSTKVYNASSAEQQLFTSTLLNLSWQLLIVVVVPFIGGHFLDTAHKTTPRWTLAGLALAFILAIITIYRAYQSLTSKQSALRGDSHE